jgi:hypothetical protein
LLEAACTGSPNVAVQTLEGTSENDLKKRVLMAEEHAQELKKQVDREVNFLSKRLTREEEVSGCLV